MATPIGTAHPDLVPALAEVRRRLFDAPYDFEFFQAVRLLGQLQPGKSPVGRYVNPQEEIVRFGAQPSLSFPASQIYGLTTTKDGHLRMDVNFIGLVGPLGLLPTHITELITNRVRAKDTALLDFINIFNHRMTSFFYQAWEKNHFTVAYERDQNDPITGFLLAIAGLGSPSLRQRQVVRDETFIYYAGILGASPKSATALEAVLADYFDVAVEIEPFIGVWRRLDEPDQTQVGDDSLDAATLGFGAVAGDEVWDQQSRVRIKLGPLSAERYREFLPSGPAWPELQALTRTYRGTDMEFEVQLILKREEVPVVELKKLAEDSPRLGWDTWMKSKPRFDRDPGDTILLLMETSNGD
jgi:type VI secretion system protein ImpH